MTKVVSSMRGIFMSPSATMTESEKNWLVNYFTELKKKAEKSGWSHKAIADIEEALEFAKRLDIMVEKGK